MSTQGYEEELRSERGYGAGLYTRLDAERARVKGAYNAALRGTGGTPVERDVQMRALAKEVKRLDHLLAQDLAYAEDPADRFVERDTRDLAERAAADQDWTYRHIVVDEAQELSEMDWRVLMRRLRELQVGEVLPR